MVVERKDLRATLGQLVGYLVGDKVGVDSDSSV